MNRFTLIRRMVFSPEGEGNPAGGDAAAAAAAAGSSPGGDAAAAAAAAAAAKPAGEADPAGGKPADHPFKWFGDEVDDDTKAYLEAKAFKKPADLYKSLRGAEKLIRGDQVAGPPDDPEKHADWLKESGLAKRLGIPEEPTGYTVKPPQFDDAIKGMIQYDDDRHGRLLAAAHKINLTPGQVEGVLGFYSAEIAADAQNYTTAAQADEEGMQTTLKREWGDGYEVNVRAALEVAAEVGLDEAAVESLRVGKVVGSAQLTKILHELAVARGNDTLKGGGKGGGDAGKNAQAELDAFNAKNVEALTKHDHPEHASALRRMQELKRAAGRGSQ